MKKNIAFSENLKRLRKEAGLSRHTLSEMICYSEKSVEKWESAHATPPLSVICRLSEIFAVSLDSLIYADETDIEYYLGVDGGGTKTQFVLTDTSLNTLNTIEMASSNPNDIGMENCLSVLKKGVTQITQGIDRKKISAFFGIAGGGISGDNASVIKKMLSGLGLGTFDNGSDADNVIELTLGDQDGICIIMGTGLIGFAKKDQKLTRCAGWGYLIDSGGSGYNIGRDALEAVLSGIDGRQQSGILRTAFEDHLKKDVRDAIPEIYSGGKRFIASLAPLVFEAAKANDPIAISIIDKNAFAVAQVINTLQKGFDSQSVPVAICGGLGKHRDILEELISKHLTCPTDIKFVTDPTVNGAILKAQKLAKHLSTNKNTHKVRI